MRKHIHFWKGLLSGLGSPTTVYAHYYACLHTTALEDMRSDWERIGNDFRKVISHAIEEEQGQNGKASPQHSAEGRRAAA